jgi:hypothetical protein
VFKIISKRHLRKLDWQIESTKMGQYYSNATITIAASSSKDVKMPFLKAREKPDATLSPRPEFEFRNSDGTISTVIGRRIPDYAGITMIGTSTLSTRGWAWQENILSARLVHYTRSEIIWECRSQQQFENGAILRSSIGLAFRFAACQENMEYYWKTLVTDFSSRQLTYESDRLPAISGVAAEVQRLTNGRYLVGLWRQWLHSDLLWFSDWACNPHHPPSPKDRESIPSWSWASVTGRVLFEYDFCEQSTRHSTLTITDVACVPRGLSPFGEAENASITVTGLLWPATLTCTNNRNIDTYDLELRGKKNRNPLLRIDTVLEDVDIIAEGGVVVRTARRASGSEASTGKAFEVTVYCLKVGGGRYKEDIISRMHRTVSLSFYLVLGCLPYRPGSTQAFSRLGLLKRLDQGPQRGAKSSNIMLT